MPDHSFTFRFLLFCMSCLSSDLGCRHVTLPPQIKCFSENRSPRKQIAGNAVKHASEDLVIAAREASSFDEVEESSEVIIDSRRVGGIAQEMMAQEEILRKERELNAAREKLAQIRRMRYKDQSDSE